MFLSFFNQSRVYQKFAVRELIELRQNQFRMFLKLLTALSASQFPKHFGVIGKSTGPVRIPRPRHEIDVVPVLDRLHQ